MGNEIISFLLQKKVIALILFVLISVISAIIITVYQRKPVKKQEEKIECFSEKLNRLLRNKKPEEQLQVLNAQFKELLNKNFKVSQKMELYEIEKEFSAKNPSIASYSRLLIEAYYSGEKITEEVLKDLAQKLVEFEIPFEPKITIPEQKSFFSLGFSRKQEPKKVAKYYPSIMAPPVRNKKIQPVEKKIEEKKEIHHGRDNHDNLSVFTKKENAENVKNHLTETKESILNVHNSVLKSKSGLLNETLSMQEWSTGLHSLKEEMINDCKRVISNLK